MHDTSRDIGRWPKMAGGKLSTRWNKLHWRPASHGADFELKGHLIHSAMVAGNIVKYFVRSIRLKQDINYHTPAGGDRLRVHGHEKSTSS